MDSKKNDLALAYVLGELNPEATAAVETEARHDPELREAIRELADGVAAAVRTLPQHGVSAGAYAAIERRVDAVEAPPRIAVGRASPFKWATLGGVAALLIAGVSIGGYELVRGRNQPVIFVTELSLGSAAVRPVAVAALANNRDGRFMQLASLAERLWQASGRGSRRGGDGYAVFDPATNQGFIAVREVPPTEPRQHYHLWIVDRETGRAHDAGPLPLAQATQGMFFFSLPAENHGRYAQPGFFVTVEDATAPTPESAPRGRVVLGKPI